MSMSTVQNIDLLQHFLPTGGHFAPRPSQSSSPLHQLDLSVNIPVDTAPHLPTIAYGQFFSLSHSKSTPNPHKTAQCPHHTC